MRVRKGAVIIEALVSLVLLLILFSSLRFFSEKKDFTPKKLLTTTALDALSVDVLRREGTSDAYGNGEFLVLGQKATVKKVYETEKVKVEVSCNGFTKVYYGSRK